MAGAIMSNNIQKRHKPTTIMGVPGAKSKVLHVIPAFAQHQPRVEQTS